MYDIWLGFNFYCDKLVKAKCQLVDWYNDGLDRGQALVMAGSTGTGKTHLGLVVLNAYGAPHQSLMVGEPDLVVNIRASYDGDGSEKLIIAQYRRIQLLILDDVGTANVKNNDWIEDIYWRILDRRAELHLPTLVTTNLCLDELKDRLGGRGFSRLMGMMGGEQNYIDLFDVADYRMNGWVNGSG